MNRDLNGQIAVRLFGWGTVERPARTWYRHEMANPKRPFEITTVPIEQPAGVNYVTPQGVVCDPPDFSGDWNEMRYLLEVIAHRGFDFQLDARDNPPIVFSLAIHFRRVSDGVIFDVWKYAPSADEVPRLVCEAVIQMLDALGE